MEPMQAEGIQHEKDQNQDMGDDNPVFEASNQDLPSEDDKAGAAIADPPPEHKRPPNLQTDLNDNQIIDSDHQPGIFRSAVGEENDGNANEHNFTRIGDEEMKTLAESRSLLSAVLTQGVDVANMSPSFMALLARQEDHEELQNPLLQNIERSSSPPNQLLFSPEMRGVSQEGYKANRKPGKSSQKLHKRAKNETLSADGNKKTIEPANMKQKSNDSVENPSGYEGMGEAMFDLGPKKSKKRNKTWMLTGKLKQLVKPVPFVSKRDPRAPRPKTRAGTDADKEWVKPSNSHGRGKDIKRGQGRVSGTNTKSPRASPVESSDTQDGSGKQDLETMKEIEVSPTKSASPALKLTKAPKLRWNYDKTALVTEHEGMDPMPEDQSDLYYKTLLSGSDKFSPKPIAGSSAIHSHMPIQKDRVKQSPLRYNKIPPAKQWKPNLKKVYGPKFGRAAALVEEGKLPSSEISASRRKRMQSWDSNFAVSRQGSSLFDDLLGDKNRQLVLPKLPENASFLPSWSDAEFEQVFLNNAMQSFSRQRDRLKSAANVDPWHITSEYIKKLARPPETSSDFFDPMVKSNTMERQLQQYKLEQQRERTLSYNPAEIEAPPRTSEDLIMELGSPELSQKDSAKKYVEQLREQLNTRQGRVRQSREKAKVYRQQWIEDREALNRTPSGSRPPSRVNSRPSTAGKTGLIQHFPRTF